MENSEIKLYSKDIQEEYKIKLMKNKCNLYEKVKSALLALGDFDTDIELSMYERLENDWIEYYQMWAKDKNDDLFIICASSSEIRRTFEVQKMTDEQTFYYDITLAKYNEITKENAECLRSDKKYKFDYGKIITDNNSYYTAFLGGGLCYQIKIKYTNVDPIHGARLAYDLNDVKSYPTFFEFVNVFQNIIKRYNMSYSELEISAYKNLKLLSNIKVSNEPKKEKVLTKKIEL